MGCGKRSFRSKEAKRKYEAFKHIHINPTKSTKKKAGKKTKK